ncbi:MAG TPA: TetR/AcrR family transcriptional regulator [Solirubrobacterales bacterium]|nr:TetR/AcrR family transcriptional regulator [Solirubrobacterales bacterium]
MAQAGGKGERETLRRLPPGRHGLSREFVAQNQQERLIAGTLVAVADHGFRETTVTLISKESGVSRRTFYSYFDTKEECFLATFDLLEEHLLVAVREAPVSRPSWTAQVQARVAALLAVLGENPDLVRFALIAPPAAGGAVLERNRRLLERLVDAVVEGAPQSLAKGGVSEVEREAMAGSLSAVLAAAVEGDGGDQLDGAFPEVVELTLAPFVGRRRAMAAAQKR